jgi:pimeloyl-ACP methyl ester carboxylesterase
VSTAAGILSSQGNQDCARRRRTGSRPIVAGVAIRGWSFGGYQAAPAVLRHPDVFHAAVAGDPVTDCYNSAGKGDPQPDQGRELASARLG